MNTVQNDNGMATLKIAVWGPIVTGKTTLSNAIVHNYCTSGGAVTKGVEVRGTKNLDGIIDLKYYTTLEDNKINRVELFIMDCGGDDHFRFIMPTYFKQINGAILCTDNNTNKISSLNQYVTDLRVYDKNLPIILALTKTDLYNQDEEYDAVIKLTELAESKGLEGPCLVSSYQKKGINNLISTVTGKILTREDIIFQTHTHTSQYKVEQQKAETLTSPVKKKWTTRIREYFKTLKG